MFGHQNNDQNDIPAPINPDQTMSEAHSADAPQMDGTAPEPFNPALPSPGTNFGSATVLPEPASAPIIISDPPKVTSPSAPSDLLSTATVGNDELLDIKQSALSQLSPLVGHLEQTPEEKFRTTMMMIQASDNQDLVKDAFAAAQEITDEKAKAQALLDIVNEINYFTQHHAA